jgi:hypothetical protein
MAMTPVVGAADVPPYRPNGSFAETPVFGQTGTVSNEFVTQGLTWPTTGPIKGPSPPLSQTAPVATTQPMIVPAAPMPEALDASTNFARLAESTWYTRIDYFSWTERLDGANFAKENGVIPTLGYQRRSGPERWRVELFGSKVNYAADIAFDDGFVARDKSFTDYLGTRFEYEFMYEPHRWPRLSVFAGAGSRLWIRNLPDQEIDPQHVTIGYQETWWTFYPYMGIESRRTNTQDPEFYWRGRAGLMAFTYEHLSNDVTLYPRQGATAQVEVGVRGPVMFLGAYFEMMQWSQSATVQKFEMNAEVLQPRSQMFLVGLKTGFSF